VFDIRRRLEFSFCTLGLLLASDDSRSRIEIFTRFSHQVQLSNLVDWSQRESLFLRKSRFRLILIMMVLEVRSHRGIGMQIER
jgi:hypothetical protein